MTSLERILRLARQTGDTVILAGDDGRHATVILSLRRYESLVAHEQDEVGELLIEAEEKNSAEIFQETPEKIPVAVPPSSEPVTQPISGEKQQEPAKNPPLQEGAGEEQFYLEPVD